MTPRAAIAALLRAAGLSQEGAAVEKVEEERPRRKPRAKRAPREAGGKKVVFRVSAEEKRQLVLAAGDGGISTYVRGRVFRGGGHSRDGLRKIALLHALGRRVQKLGENPQVDNFMIAGALGDICAAIRDLAFEMDDIIDQEEATT